MPFTGVAPDPYRVLISACAYLLVEFLINSALYELLDNPTGLLLKVIEKAIYAELAQIPLYILPLY